MNIEIALNQLLHLTTNVRTYEIILLGLVLVAAVLIWRIILNKLNRNQNIKIYRASLTVEELEEHARALSLAHTVSSKKNILNWPVGRMNDDFKYITDVYKLLNDAVAEKRAVPPAAEWLLDNFYVIEEQVKSIRKDLTKKSYYRLPVLRKGIYKDYTRVYAIAIELAAHQNGHIEENAVLKYLDAYQKHNILFDRELWVIPTMIRLVLIENIRLLCERINDTQKQWLKANDVFDRWQISDEIELSKVLALIDVQVNVQEERKSAFIEHLLYRLRCSGKSYSNVLQYIDNILDKYGVNTDSITQNEHNAQAIHTVSIGNCIVSLKYVTTHNWGEVFESSSFVEKILCQDPGGVYCEMDIQSRNSYRDHVEKLASAYGVSELHIAREAIRLAIHANQHNEKLHETETVVGSDLRRKAHVGYYLVDDGVKLLERSQKGKKKPVALFKDQLNEHSGVVYMGCISLGIAAIIAFSIWYTGVDTKQAFLICLVAAALLVPASEIAIALVNWLICKFKKPTIFYRLELKAGIPDDLRTIVAIPALLTNEARVTELLENIENHYLSNTEGNLYFALIGAFKDSKEASDMTDDQIIAYALSKIKRLNEKYAKGQQEIFYFYHRMRTFNESDNNWIGWERKRGALMEFNEMLLGSDVTTFSVFSSGVLPARNIKYIITLDADTILPIDMAKKMIGTMAHPLNRPLIDPTKGIVVKGYGLMQPKVSFDMESANRSIFSSIYTQQEGLDPYASAISDVYQDFFGEGIFTGKGIYDLKVFHHILKDVIPENKVLSHDLLEGTYVRAALVSSLELVDAYPSRYNAFITRLRRWIRGDWQLLPWLGNHIPNKNGDLVPNPLTNISKWKIIDNMRRSLVAPSVALLFFLGFSILPGDSWYWAGIASIILFLPLIECTLGTVFRSGPYPDRIKRHITGFFGMIASLSQSILSMAFLPYQALMNLNAIAITLIRVFITKKNMLEWVASADAEKSLDNNMQSYLKSMASSIVSGIFLLFLVMSFRPSALPLGLVFVMLWCAAPVIAYWISKDRDQEIEQLDADAIIDLRKMTRKTWRYFEEFANRKNNYLVPDNFQVDPRRGIAYRTSPTNIGLGLLATLTGRDMGYIGTLELIDSIDRSITTIEGMEKWNDHLFNWYNTITLEPLEPRYVSTVDSGNYVCYLITLIHGLNEYFSRPLVDMVYISGLLDTIRSGSRDNLTLTKQRSVLQEFEEKGQMNVHDWQRILTEMTPMEAFPETAKDIWGSKLGRMLQQLKREQESFFPWLALMEDLPKDFEQDPLSLVLEELKMLSENPVTLSTLNLYNQALKTQLEVIVQVAQKTKCTERMKLMNWLESFRFALRQSSVFGEETTKRFQELVSRIDRLSIRTRFDHFYHQSRNLFSIGYNIELGKLTNSYYDLLASEARQTSYMAIARGEVPSKHWFVLGRSLTVVDHFKGLVSWSGTMFEYLMPLLIMKHYKNSLLDETYSFVIKSQIKYGKQRRMPWGASESAFYALDSHLDYQYKAIGVPWLGLKRGLVEDAVTTPYATFLALLVRPREAYQNLLTLKKEGLEGTYGFYEAADYTPEHLSSESHGAVIKSYMAHHQGMTLMALNNYLNGFNMQNRFSSDPHMKSARLLLQERVPNNIVFAKDNQEKILPAKSIVNSEKGAVRSFRQPDAILPNVHILSNGNYSVMLTDQGTGYSKSKTAAITRWRQDSILGQYGMFFYLKNMETDQYWSSTYAPIDVTPKQYEVTFSADKAVYKRTDGPIETATHIVVASGDNTEIRQMRITNNGEKESFLEITSYCELVLASQESDLAHPAFSNLFISTEYLSEYHALIANRRDRNDRDKSTWIAQLPVIKGRFIGDIQYETDRMQFVGRGRNLHHPASMESGKPMTNSVGAVLDPILSLRTRVKIEPGRYIKLSYVTILADSREELMELILKYQNAETCAAAFWTATTRGQVETKFLNIKPEEMELYQSAMSNILFIGPLRRQYSDYIQLNTQGQSALWAYGISGDRPIVLVTLDHSDHMDLLSEVLKAHEYWWLKDLKTDLVIVFREENTYLNPLRSLVNDIVYSSHTKDVLSRLTNVFILGFDKVSEQNLHLLCSTARMIFKGGEGSMREHLENVPLTNFPPMLPQQSVSTYTAKPCEPLSSIDALHFYNGFGGFGLGGKEYHIHLSNGANTPMPWINVIANPTFGFLVSESGGGYTWSGNSRENKLSPWTNDPVCDLPGEIFYLREESGAVWSMNASPIREAEPYTVKHGFGYSEFLHESHGITQVLTQFVPIEGSVKLSLISLKNESDQARSLALTYYMTPVLGVNYEDTALHLATSQSSAGTILIENAYNREFANQICFMDASEESRSVTGDRKEFFGAHKADAPEALKRTSLSGALGAGFDPCAAMQIQVLLQPQETKEFVFLLGCSNSVFGVEELTSRYRSVEAAKQTLEQVKAFWSNKLTVISVETPDPAMDFLLNGWMQYQIIVCRLWARTAFYQSGGAYGFRDQLQDSMAAAPIDPSLARAQLLKHAAHQFLEGDVLHWWHEPANKGTRTRVSDDFLWLPFVTASYLKQTNDDSLLDEVVSFLEDDLLKAFEEERYCQPSVTDYKTSFYEHCIRSLEHSFRFGPHGLPLIGCGDWNDGMNTVGNQGIGESVWLGWFLSATLQQFIPICKKRGDYAHAVAFEQVNTNLVLALETHGWDGKWYRRAYFDNGIPLGAASNTECKIDSLSQSWSVISGSADKERAEKAMSSLENYLVKRENGLIKLLTPPFQEGDLEPGYIKCYAPGVRENGGQYTHAAAWVVIATAMLGDGEKALEYFDLINPINHTRTDRECAIYKVEPYVMAADVYGEPPHAGRGGWTWYTGSAGWIYKAGVESILGLQKVAETIVIDPCIPKNWKAYSIRYQYRDTVYHIQVQNPDGVCKGVQNVSLDGTSLENQVIPLVDDGKKHEVIVVLG